MGRLRFANTRMMRQKPTRDPNSNMASPARSRSPVGTGECGTSAVLVSERPSPSGKEYSDPSS